MKAYTALSIAAPIPHTRHVSVTKTTENNRSLFDVHRRLYTSRHGKRREGEYRPPAEQLCLFVCVYLICA